MIYLFLVITIVGIILLNRKNKSVNESYGFNIENLSHVDIKDFNLNKDFGLILWSSSSCEGCKVMKQLVLPLESKKMDVVDIVFEENEPLHTKYSVDAVPTVTLIDSKGKVLKNYLGKQCTNDFWEDIHTLTGSKT